MSILCNSCGEENFELDRQCWSCGAELYYTDALPDGSVLQNRYVIERLIKLGGMGAIYRALDERLNRFCAIKEMLTTYATGDQKKYAERRFKVESKLLSWLDHPNLPTVLDYFIEEGRYYLVMSYIDGVDLNEVLETRGNPGLPEEMVVDWSLQILDVLDYLHSQNPPVVYRDIKPGNIMLHRDGRVMLIDFGIARTIQPEGKKIRYTSIGTDGYASEEQYRGGVEPRSDLYSLGATMHHLLTGITPVAFNLKHVRNNAPWVSPGLEQVIMKALEYEAQNRYNSAKEMKRSLEKIRNKPVLSPDIPKAPLRRPSGAIRVAKPKKPVSYEQILGMLEEQEKDDIKRESLELEEKRNVYEDEPKTIEYCGDPVIDRNAEVYKPSQTVETVPQQGRRFRPREDIGGAEKISEQRRTKSGKLFPEGEKISEQRRTKSEKIFPEGEETSKRRKTKSEKFFPEPEKREKTLTSEDLLSQGVGGVLGKLLQSSGKEEEEAVPGFVKLASIKPGDRRTSGELGLGDAGNIK